MEGTLLNNIHTQFQVSIYKNEEATASSTIVTAVKLANKKVKATKEKTS